ncbi:DEAD/DEAH box helicase [Sphingomonas immobilis]|uniref:Helicase n=1 Tax=Sphingomonas immobilis TaxID=3063997 RepID=A0ABT8ZX83_9SPHN|nr:hypothetical protein [Sphingomonas sp. CA1-15]MDO7841102.1 hypothetical protein [Sphingomonas sp. CA1-15]
MDDAYLSFLASKSIVDPSTGLSGDQALPEDMFAFQSDITRFALRRGRAALFAGTGLGKTIMELGWGDAIRRETRRPILQFAPLAVSSQIVREANKFGIPARLVTSMLDVDDDLICIANFQKMQHFDIADFGASTLDESSILKSVDGHYRSELIAACQSVPFRLAATATPAPNDFMELGNHAEFLGIMSYTDMLATFFVHDGGSTRDWRLKGHAEDEFWRWMASWAVMVRKPSDLGYSDEGYDLPELRYHSHIVADTSAPPEGMLFALPATTLQERLTARRNSVSERVARAISVTPEDDPFVWWCNLNEEAEKVAAGIPGAVEVRGSDKDTDKERKLIDFSEGRIRVLVTKPSICGFGMNWQHCHRTGFVGLNDSFEQFYQAIRRFWRFGQTKPVDVHIVSSELEGATLANIRRKEADADRMAEAMVRHMADLSSAAVRGLVRDTPSYDPRAALCVPNWLEAA